MPRLDAEGQAQDDAASATSVPSELGETVELPHGNALTIDEAALLAAARPHRTIVMLGDKYAGKTTIVAELHQAFLKGSFSGYLFAGSNTLPAFEKRCALGRTISRQSKPATARTQLRDGLRLLHLAVRDIGLAQPIRNLLLTDVSGELSKAARRTKQDAQELAPIVRQAASVVLVMDGAKIAAAKERQRVRADTKTLLRALVEGGALHARSRVDLVLNKWDWVASDAALTEFVAATLEEAANCIRADVGSVSAHRVAARLRKGVQLDRWFGMETLFGGWVNDTQPALPDAQPALPSFSRKFLNFGYANE